MAALCKMVSIVRGVAEYAAEGVEVEEVVMVAVSVTEGVSSDASIQKRNISHLITVKSIGMHKWRKRRGDLFQVILR